MKLSPLLLLSVYFLSSHVLAMKPVSHTISNNTEYTKGEFEFEKDKTSTYTTPHRPQKAPVQSVKIYKETPQENPYERILMRVEPGKDGRSRISNTTQWPYLFHAQLSLHYSDGEYGGSGVLVGPHHILTAGHNVFSHKTKEWAKNIVVRLALNDQVAPFGDYSVIKFFTFEEWTKDQNPNLDIALITLGHSIGLEAGWTGLLAEDDAILMNEDVHVTGYPGDKGFNQLWSMAHRVKNLQPERMFYETDTYGGQSGGSVWIKKYGNPYAIGVHTLGEGKLYEGNSGVRISHQKLDMIQSWISSTRDIKPAILPLPPEPFSLPTSNQAPTFSFEDWRKGLKTINKSWAKVLLEKIPSMDITLLELNHSNIGDEGTKTLALMLPYSQITVLYMAANQMGDEGAKALANALPHSQITSFGVGSNLMGDEGAKAVAFVLPHSKITWMDMSSNNIKDEGAKAVALALPHSLITALGMGYNKIRNEGANALALMLPQSKITWLSVAGNQIGSEGSEALERARTQSPKLTSLQY